MRERQREIIAELGVKPEIDPRAEVEGRINFLATELGQCGLNGFVLGISGGQDSLLAGMLAQRATEKLRSEGTPAEFHAVLLPYGSQADRDDAVLAMSTINPDYSHDLNIQAATDGMVSAFTKAEGRAPSDYNKGNVKARERMTAEYLYSGEYNGLLVVGTDHATEAVMGFFTKYGDGGADLVPLAGLNKRQGRAATSRTRRTRTLHDKSPNSRSTRQQSRPNRRSRAWRTDRHDRRLP